VLASLYPTKEHAERTAKYLPYEQTLNTNNLNVPLALKDIPKFDILNPSISVNVISLDDKDFCIEYCSPERKRAHHVNLLLLTRGIKTLCMYQKHVPSSPWQNKTRMYNICVQWGSPSLFFQRHARSPYPRMYV